VVGLAEDPVALARRGHRRVFQRRRPAAVDRAHQDRPAARLEHAVDLGQRPAVVADVLEHVVADQPIEVLGLEGEVEQVELDVGERRVEVAAQVTQPLDPLQAPQQRVLGGDVEHRARPGEEVGLALEEEPEHAVALERAAAGAFGVSTAAVRQEARERGLAAGALDRVAAVAPGADRAEQAVAALPGYRSQQGALQQRVVDRAVLGAEARAFRRPQRLHSHAH